MILDIQFIFIATIIILTLLPLYIYRQQIYTKFYKKGNVKGFMTDIEIYLKANHPRIKFDFSVISKFEDEKDVGIQETLIVEEFVNQFSYHEYELITQRGVSKDKLWNTYMKNSQLLKDNKLPIDWAQRKEAAWNREQGSCNRCGIRTKLSDSNILLAKQMKDGGGFNLENLVVLCSDCTRLIKSENIERTKGDLKISDNLMKKVID